MNWKKWRGRKRKTVRNKRKTSEEEEVETKLRG
jgi:hypothetical protein